MKIVLSRGHSSAFSQDSDCRITAQEFLYSNAEPRILHFSLGPLGQVFAKLHQQGIVTDFKVQAEAKFWWVTLSGATRVWFAALPWGELPDLSLLLASPAPENFYIPWRGWRDSIWYDGPLLWIAAGKVQKAVFPGAAAELRVETLVASLDGASEWYRQRAVRGWKQSLAWAFREGLALDPQCGYRLQLPAASVQTLIVLLSLRLAYPALGFYWLDRPTLYASQWKRLAQNLNIEIWPPAASLPILRELKLDLHCERWSVELSQAFLLNLQSWIPLIPGRLMDFLMIK